MAVSGLDRGQTMQDSAIIEPDLNRLETTESHTLGGYTNE
jgi:hypothetical protein